MPKTKTAKTKWARSIVLAALAVLAIILVIPRGSDTTGCAEVYRNDTVLSVASKTIELETVETQSEREKGLSGRACLPKDKGMLFVFDAPADYGFWMKDMNFAIDIIWLDESKSVIYVEKNLAPSTYPSVFMSGGKAKYVIELGADMTDELGIQKGDVLKITNN